MPGNSWSRKGFSLLFPLLLALAGCNRRIETPAPRPSNEKAGGFHAKPLDSIAPKVPPLVKSAWMESHFPPFIPTQGKAPAPWPAIEKDLRPEACGTCHPGQYQDWKESRHRAAMGPGVLGQLLDMEVDAPTLSISCQRCHAPLAEQIPYLKKGERNPNYQEGFREQGVTCAACHVRGHMRHGPDVGKKVDPKGPHGGFVIRSEYTSPVFCASCHDFPPGSGVHGKMLLETAEEWRRTEFAAEGKTCQTCHMPDRRHLWKGIHDPDMVRSAVSIEAGFMGGASADSLAANLKLTNVGAGHRLPTYSVPVILLIWEQLDATGSPIAGTRSESGIARSVNEEAAREFFDTRLLPGESLILEYRSRRHPLASKAEARVEVWPDEAYRKYFRRMLDTPELRPGIRAGVEKIEQAHQASLDSRYVLWKKAFPLPTPRP